ncbi:hypothetical protein [Clostridium thailandense]|uniref:hypothetical protein n=1 Tax=Clostridium thailandense TaxID=2794346 RepID=UPI003988B4F2
MFVEVGDIVPSDGKVIEGLALADESARTGDQSLLLKKLAKSSIQLYVVQELSVTGLR